MNKDDLKQWVIAGIVTVAILFWVGVSINAEQKTNSPKKASKKHHVFLSGDVVKISYADSDTPTFGAKEDAWDAMWEALNANDKIGMNKLIAAGRVALIESGTKGKILVVGFGSCKVRLLSGAYATEAVWVVKEAVQKRG